VIFVFTLGFVATGGCAICKGVCACTSLISLTWHEQTRKDKSRNLKVNESFILILYGGYGGYGAYGGYGGYGGYGAYVCNERKVF
jgi:hypothetical protein